MLRTKKRSLENWKLLQKQSQKEHAEFLNEPTANSSFIQINQMFKHGTTFDEVKEGTISKHEMSIEDNLRLNTQRGAE